MRGKTFILAALFVLLATLTTACGGSATPAGGEAESPIIRQVFLNEYTISPKHIKVDAGVPIRFVVKNEGNFTHEFRVLMNPPIYVEVAPKSKKWLDATFEKGGEFEVVCETGGHENLGMKGDLSVEVTE